MNSKMDININPTDPKTLKEIHNILITQPKPESDKSPYFEMARKFNVDLSFANPISVDPVSSKEFRKQKIDISSFTAVIFNSRNAIDHFFRICEEMRINVSQDVEIFLYHRICSSLPSKIYFVSKKKSFFQ